MNKTTLFLLIALAFAPVVLPAGDTGEFDTFESDAARFAAAETAPSGRQYAPDRAVQMLHLALEVTPDFKHRTVEGRATLTFKPLFRPVRELRLDAVDLDVHSVTSSEKIQAHQVTAEELIVTFSGDLPVGKEASVTVAYSAEPKQGLYFRTPEMGYREGDTHLFSQGEEIEARHWYPCLDSPNQKFTSEVTCRAPSGMTVISNGRLISSKADGASGLTSFHWAQETPHANYLITLCAGYFKKLEDRYKDIPLGFYTPPSESATAANSFRDTKDMMAFFEDEIGVPYAWPKYDQVCVNDFVAGGMENTGATTLTDDTLHTEATETLRSSEDLVAHELAHQWFGDLVTCKDWSHVWLNEGFATYYETLYRGHKHGRDELLYELYGRARMLTGVANDTNAIVRRTFGHAGEMFNHLAYDKGGWVLHMLRSELGADVYRRSIKAYLERHRHGNVVTEDLRSVIEELTGRSYDQFFDQWLYHAHHPELEIGYQWDEPARLARVSIRQVQRVGDNVLLFSTPLTLRFRGRFGVVDRVVQVSRQEEEFSFSLESAPELVRVDPDYALLAKISFNLPNAMLDAQLAAKDDVVGRLLAVEQLAGRKDGRSVARLRHLLNQDDFYGVRVEASQALRSAHTDEALEALIDSRVQADARVRRQVVEDIGAFYAGSAYESARATLREEKNPGILAQAIRSLGAYSKPESRDTLLGFLEVDSFRNELAGAAVEAMRTQDDPAYLPVLLASLAKRESAYPSRGFAQALGAVAWLGRNEVNKDAAREFLLRYINSKRRGVQIASINALGVLGDPKAIGALETFSKASKESRERTAAARAVADLRAGRKPVDDFKNLRQEVLDLQKASRDLRRELDELKKRAELKPGPPAKATPPPDSRSRTQPMKSP